MHVQFAKFNINAQENVRLKIWCRNRLQLNQIKQKAKRYLGLSFIEMIFVEALRLKT